MCEGLENISVVVELWNYYDTAEHLSNGVMLLDMLDITDMT